MQFIAGDIGGTKTILALCSSEDRTVTVHAESEFVSKNYTSFTELLRQFIQRMQGKESPKYAYIGVAGPVVNGKCKLTNLDWQIDEKQLSREFNLDSAHLINDLMAIASYVPYLKANEVKTLNEGTPPEQDDGGTIAVIAPGTGLGEGFLTNSGGTWRAYPSEGGHADYAPTTEAEEGLRKYIARNSSHVSYEKICSGPGIHTISSYYHEADRASDCPALAMLDKLDDPTPTLVKEALREPTRCKTCVRTLDTFISVYASEAANLALKVLARNGVYISGRLSLEILPALENGNKFMETFLRKGRMSEIVAQMPVKIILTHRAALLGAAHYGMEILDRS